ncbi:MAG: RHS repeat-associated core domain-containing protein [Thermoanaerobaculia bacterium]
MLLEKRREIASLPPALDLASGKLASSSTTWTSLPDLGETTFSAGVPQWGTDYMHARYFSPTTARFLSTDPIGGNPAFPQTWNRYAYVVGNPLKHVDPTGELPASAIADILGRYFDEAEDVPDRLRAQFAASLWGRKIEMHPPDFVGPLPKNVLPLWVPPGANVTANMALAKSHSEDPLKARLDWFKAQVQNKGPWDYKQQGRIFANFGNFNYGATGHSAGFPRNTLVREAGRAQVAAGTSIPEWGDPGSRFDPNGGSGFFGDDPVDQFWIIRGFLYVP